MSQRVEERRLKVWSSLLRAHAGLFSVLNRELEEERGLPLVWYDVLVNLQHAPAGRMRMQELAGSVLSGPAIPLIAVASGLVVGTMRADRRPRRRPRAETLAEAA